MNEEATDSAILDARLLVLTRNLERVRDAISGQQIELQGGLSNYPVPTDAWERAFVKVVDIVGEELDEIADLRRGVQRGETDERRAWENYGTHFARARNICRDSVELLGGFALREQMVKAEDDRLLNRQVCDFVEAIVAECATGHPDLMPLLAIPAAEDPLAETQARIIRVRFPEWTLWTVPLAAHEYCRATFDDVSSLSKVVEHESARRGQGENGALEAAQGIVPLLIADAFALRVMGPAYACAAVLLRLDPFTHPSGPRAHDIERAETIFAVLEQLYPDQGENEPLQFVNEYVRSHWDAALTAVAPDLDLTEIQKQATFFATEGVETLDKKIYPQAHYISDSEGSGNDWRTAERLRKYFQGMAGDVGVGEAQPKKPDNYGVRDVLNAAWSARLRNPRAVMNYANAAGREWEKLLAAARDGGEIRNRKAEPARSGQPKR